MFTAAELLEVLRQRRIRKSLRPEVPGQLPPGWQAWLEAMPARVGGVTGAPPAEFIALLAQRELAMPPRRVGALNRWQAFATLWRQQWQPPVREERGQRWFAIGFSATLHVLFVVLLLWLGYVQLMAMPPAAGDNVVQVEFIGEGTPEDTGGGVPGASRDVQPDAVTPAPAAASQPQPANAQPQPDTPAAPATPPEAAEPQPPAPVAAQPLQVTEVPQPDIAFTLPPPKPRTPDLQQPTIVVPQLRTTPEEIVVEVPHVTPERRPDLPQRDIVVPELRERVAEIEVPERLPQARAVPQRTATPQLQVPALRTEPGELRIPTTSPTATRATASSSAPAAATAPGSTAPATGPVSPSSGSQPRATAAGSGVAPTARPGAQPGVAKSDDWGAASRNRPGGAPAGRPGDRPGLFNADGSPRLGDAPGARPPNAPGTVDQNLADLDRAGTWLKRPPYDYTPTMFDRFWVPRETLLQEWVRKGIKKVSIPIPGTKLRLQCVVSLLQAGAGCGLSNPDVNEQPATARPPPDIPFKPHLQEDNGSVKPAPG